MTILEQILAGLQQKFAGVDTAILNPHRYQKGRGCNGRDKSKLHC